MLTGMIPSTKTTIEPLKNDGSTTKKKTEIVSAIPCKCTCPVDENLIFLYVSTTPVFSDCLGSGLGSACMTFNGV